MLNSPRFLAGMIELLTMNGTENTSDTKKEEPGSGGDITAITESFNELGKETEIGLGLKEL